MYTETLGRWHTVDLFIGLAYLSHREALEYPAQDIALRGRPVSQEQMPDSAHALLVGSPTAMEVSTFPPCQVHVSASPCLSSSRLN